MEGFFLLHGQTNSRAQDDGETPMGKARNTDQLLVTPISGNVSDPEKGNSPDESDDKYGLKNYYRVLDDTPRAVSGGRKVETEEDRKEMTDPTERMKMQNRIAQGNYRKRTKKRLYDLGKSQGPSSVPQSKSSIEDPPESHSKEKADPETEVLRQKKGGRRNPLTQKQKKIIRVARSRSPDVESAGQGPFSEIERAEDSSTDEDSVGSASVAQILGITPEYEPLSESDSGGSNEDESFQCNSPLWPQSVVGDESLGDGAGRKPELLEYVDMQSLRLGASFSNYEKTSPAIGHTSVSSPPWWNLPPEQTSKSGDHSFTAGANHRERVSVRSDPSDAKEDSGEATVIKRARNTVAARKSPAKRWVRIEQLQVETQEAQKWKEEAEDLKEEAQDLKEEVQYLKEDAQSLEIVAQKWRGEAQKSEEEAQKLKEEAQKWRGEAQKSKEEAQELKEEAQKWRGEAQKSKEAALTKTSKTSPDSDQASPVLIPRATSTLGRQTKAQELKCEANRDAFYTLPPNVHHWKLHGISRWLVKSYYCSQSTLINLCNRARGCRRISWTCECGMKAHWDLSSRIPDAKAAALIASLDRPNNVRSLATDSNGQKSNSSPSSSPESQHSDGDERHASTPPSSASENEDGVVCLDIPQRPEAENIQKPLMPRFIELCINSGRNKKIVAEINLTEMETDADLFIAIAEQYRRSRNRRGYVAVRLPQFLKRYMTIPSFESRFMRPSDIIFRKFILYQHQCPEIAICNPGLPPACEVNRGKYDYKPCPMELDEIMPAHHFFHLLDDPIPHTSDTWTQRLPKKLHDSLLSTRGQTAPTSWGIHINETPNWHLIHMTIFLILLASGVFSITWAAVTKDVQGAFGIGAYVVAVLTTGMTALFFKCSEAR